MRTRVFEKVVDHVFPRRKELFEDGWILFDFPDYGELPQCIVDALSSEAVDAMQDILQLTHKSKRDFARAYKKRMLEIGESVGRPKKIVQKLR